ncbi:MAG: aminopeptidase P family protein [Melioribacteraceae bacterium]|nr:aminopeptidase P family protein [Melioribacteraceae bacterium]
MFNSSTYFERRKELKNLIGSGLIFFPGNNESPRNYPSEVYPFRQDSSFLYYFGLDFPGLAGIIDIDNDNDMLFGNDRELDDVVWMGPDDPLSVKAKNSGVEKTFPFKDLEKVLQKAKSEKRIIHFLPQFKHDLIINFEGWLGIHHSKIKESSSIDLIKAVVSQRSIKSDEEIAEMEKALDISLNMNLLAMRHTRPGLIEKEVQGPIEGMAIAMGNGISFPVIFSVHGETLHNPFHKNMMNDGDIVILDSGAESDLHYCSDITRTFPVNGKFSDKQKLIYETVLRAETSAIEMVKPGISFRDCHIKAAQIIAEGLKDIGLMKGNAEDAVSNGAHALFFPHGLGHMLGLDVHDMEGLGENFVGYDENTQRSGQFGLAYLRFAKVMQPGHTLTVEPGCYFIPQLIKNWKDENKHSDFINYDKIEEYLDFGGVRIEDDVLVTDNGHRVLGRHIPKTVAEVEEACNA